MFATHWSSKRMMKMARASAIDPTMRRRCPVSKAHFRYSVLFDFFTVQRFDGVGSGFATRNNPGEAKRREVKEAMANPIFFPVGPFGQRCKVRKSKRIYWNTSVIEPKSFSCPNILRTTIKRLGIPNPMSMITTTFSLSQA